MIITPEMFIKKPEAEFIKFHNQHYEKFNPSYVLFKNFELSNYYFVQDAFIKKLILSNAVIDDMFSIQYSILSIEEIFSIYDDIFDYICKNSKIYASIIPVRFPGEKNNVEQKNLKIFKTSIELKEEFNLITEDKEILIYTFLVFEDKSVQVSYCIVSGSKIIEKEEV